MSQEDYDKPDNQNFYHKRNLTLYLAYPCPGDNPDGKFFDQDYDKGTLNDVSNKRKKGKDVLKPQIKNVPSPNVICAVNTMGQHRYAWNGANALCTDGIGKDEKWGGKFHALHAFQCQVSFVGSSYKTKRDGTPQEPVGYFGDDPYYSIKRGDEMDYERTEPEYTGNGPWDEEDRGVFG